LFEINSVRGQSQTVGQGQRQGLREPLRTAFKMTPK
jgi:hypothetical protein